MSLLTINDAEIEALHRATTGSGITLTSTGWAVIGPGEIGDATPLWFSKHDLVKGCDPTTVYAVVNAPASGDYRIATAALDGTGRVTTIPPEAVMTDETTILDNGEGNRLNVTDDGRWFTRIPISTSGDTHRAVLAHTSDTAAVVLLATARVTCDTGAYVEDPILKAGRALRTFVDVLTGDEMPARRAFDLAGSVMQGGDAYWLIRHPRRAQVDRAMEERGGVTQAARELGITGQTVYNVRGTTPAAPCDAQPWSMFR